MSISNDFGLLKKYDEIKKVGSMDVTILHDQVTEIVVADLMAKYKACKQRNDSYVDSFKKVLSFYLDEGEMKEMEAL